MHMQAQGQLEPNNYPSVQHILDCVVSLSLSVIFFFSFACITTYFGSKYGPNSVSLLSSLQRSDVAMYRSSLSKSVV